MFLKEVVKQNALYLIANTIMFSQEQPIVQRKVVCDYSQIKYYASTPNTIIYYNNGSDEGFLRECRVHSNPRNYLRQLIDEYCKYVFVNEHSNECRLILEDKLKEKKSFNKFFSMGAGTASYTNITKFRHTHDPRYIGIEHPYPNWFEKQLLQLVQYMWGALEEYRYQCRLPYGKFQTYNSSRSVVTKKIADYIGMHEIVPVTEYIELNISGEKHIGVSVDKASGFSPDVISVKDSYTISPEFQKDTLSLNILDVICHQKDHRPDNYFVQVDANAKITGLSTYDNDCPTTLFVSNRINFNSYVGYSPIVTSNGIFNRPFLDKNVVEQLNRIDETELYMLVGHDMTKLQFRCLCNRIRKLNESIRKAIKNQSTILLEEADWSDKTIEIELSGKYGNTYLNYFNKHYCYVEGK